LINQKEHAMPAIPSTQVPVEYEGKAYSGVYSVSGKLMIARIPGVGSTSREIEERADLNHTATELLHQILEGAAGQGRL
jgi:hypothetical protein